MPYVTWLITLLWAVTMRSSSKKHCNSKHKNHILDAPILSPNSFKASTMCERNFSMRARPKSSRNTTRRTASYVVPINGQSVRGHLPTKFL